MNNLRLTKSYIYQDSGEKYRYTGKLCIAIYILFYNHNSKKYQESRENRGAMVIIPIGLEIFRSQNTKDSKFTKV